MHPIKPLLPNYARQYYALKSFNFVFLCGNSIVGCKDVILEVASYLELHGFLWHYGLHDTTNNVLLMLDIVLHYFLQDVHVFLDYMINVYAMREAINPNRAILVILFSYFLIIIACFVFGTELIALSYVTMS